MSQQSNPPPSPPVYARIRFVGETVSTNDDAAALLGDPDAAGLTIVADRQREGRGRKGRAWVGDGTHALLCTTVLARTVSTADLWSVTFWCGLAVRGALSDLGISTRLSWPNDVLLDGRKVAGLLCISRVLGDRAHVGCGVGINLRRPTASHPMLAVRPEPAFCDDVRAVGRDEMLAALLSAYDRLSRMLDDPPAVARAWEEAAGLPGARYRIASDDGSTPYDATALALREGGLLEILRDDGVREQVAAADVHVLR